MSQNAAVMCAHTELVEIAKLHPHPKNPNKHPAKQVRMLAKLIQHHGWRSPIVVSKRSGYIVEGHGRLMAAKQLGQASVPVDYQEFASEADEVAHLVADNKIHELSDLDNTMLNDLIKLEVLAAGLDVELTGFDQEAFDRITVSGYTRKAKTEAKSECMLIVTCKGEDDRALLKAELEAKGYACKVTE